jgi:peptidoglycan/LPS O-acetylase OafA/YrhL
MRQYELDWLRALAVLVVFLYHSARFFNGQYWDIRNTGRSAWVDLGAGFVGLWLIPLFFLVSGAATRFTLERHSSREYVQRRFKRLLLPFVFGALLLSPLQAFLLSRTAQSLKSGWLAIYADFFTANLRAARWSLAWLFEGFGYHLLFLGFLFVFSVLALPVFAALGNRAEGRRLIDWLAEHCTSVWALLVWAVPLTIVQCALRAAFPEYLGPADFCFWLPFFLYGYLLYADPRILRALEEQWRRILRVAVTCLLVLVIARYAGLMAAWQQHPSYSGGFILFQVLWSLGAWTWLLYILSLGIRFLRFGNAVIRYATAAVLPFYVFHQPVILAVGLLVAKWNLNVTVGGLCVSALSMALTLAIYEGIIRRTRLTRVAFGVG